MSRFEVPAGLLELRRSAELVRFAVDASVSQRWLQAPCPRKRYAIPATTTALTPGAVLRKTDREGKVRCECTVEAGGFRYKGELFNSLSGAAAAAAKDLGLSGTSFNGFVFWGLKPSGRDPLHRVEHLWQRYSNAAAQLLIGGGAGRASRSPDRMSRRAPG